MFMFSLIGILALCIGFPLYISIYNIFLHPIRRYPGPKLWAVTRWPLSFHTFQGDSRHIITKLHQEYGPIVRIAPDELSFTNPAAWQTIYGHRTTEMPRNLDGRAILPATSDTPSLITAPSKLHQRLRKSVSTAFSSTALQAQQSRVREFIELLVSQLKQETAKGLGPLDIGSFYDWTSFDIVSSLALGKSFNSLEKLQHHPWVADIQKSLRYARWAQPIEYYGLSWLMTLLTPRDLSRARKSNQRFTMSMLDKRIQTGDAGRSGRQDFMAYALRKKEDYHMTDGELRNVMSNIIVAGGETTASLLCGLTYHLLTTPHAHERLKTEIRSHFTSDEDMHDSQLKILPYLCVCILEGLRIFPPVPIASPRIVPTPGENVAGGWVPAGISVGVHHWATYSCEQNFRDAKLFRPERWLDDPSEWPSPTYFAGDRRDALRPFSVGPRGCLGEKLAWSEVRQMIALLWFNFDMELDVSSQTWSDDQKSFLLWSRTPLMVKMKIRRIEPCRS